MISLNSKIQSFIENGALQWCRWQSGAGEEGAGRLVSVNKWEFASQIGTVSLIG